MSKRYRNLELPDVRVVLRSFHFDNPRDMKAKMTSIEGEFQPVGIIGPRGKNSMQVCAECGDPLPVPAGNICDRIPPFQEETEDGLAPEFRRIAHGGGGDVIPADKTLFIRCALPDEVFMQTAQNRFFRPFELVLPPAEEQTIRAKALFSSAAEPDARVRGIFPPADFALVRHDDSFPQMRNVFLYGYNLTRFWEKSSRF